LPSARFDRAASSRAEPDTPLLWVLREQLGLTGTKYGCGVAQCGACTVHLDGVPTRSCVRPVSTVEPTEKIVTIEGLSPDGSHPVQKAWAALDVPQCGFCQSGMIMATTALLKAKAEPDRRRHRRGHHQHLPLRHLQPHPRGHQGGGGGGNTKAAALAIQHTDGSTT
jgi:isoquinoline 1-oxidoreductase alpha subunit